MKDLEQRIRCKKLISKVAPAETAVNMIKSGMSVGICSDLRPICHALEKRAKEDPNFGIQLWSGVAEFRADRTLGKLGKITRRIGQQASLKTAINAKKADFLDASLGFFYQSIRSGEYGPLDLAIVEAVGITENGNLIPSYRLGDMPNFIQCAKQVIVQLNTCYPLEFEGMHDIYLPQNPPRKQPILITRVDDRIGTPYMPLDPEKVAFIVPSETPEPTEIDEPMDEVRRNIGKNLITFLREEICRGRIPPNLLPIEIGLGSTPAAVLDELGKSEFENLEFYSAVLNDRVLDLFDRGKVRAASGTGFLLTPQGEGRLIKKLDDYKKHVVLRPIEICDCPEVLSRLGILALNGAVEVDIYGHANSSHALGGDVISGVGGASEFASNAYLSVILLPSIVKSGNISCIVPMVSHVDISEHGVDIVATDQGVADLRGLTPKERPERIIHSCAHPAYRPILQDYFRKAMKHGGAHEPVLLEEAFSFHQRYLKTGSMKRSN